MAEEAKAKTPEVKEVKKEKMVTITIPRMKADEEDVFVSVNMRTWIIKRGVPVEVPECVALAIRDREAMLNEIFEKSAKK
jgi:hypothetical protein